MRLFLECKPDEMLAMTLGIPRKAIIHSHSKGRVAKSLAQHSGVAGMVDEDFGEKEPLSLRRYGEVSSSHDVKLRLDSERKNRLVVICPRLEPWLIKTAKAANVDMKQFGLPTSLRDLDADINHRLPSLERLLNRLIEAKSPRLLHLRALLLDQPSD